jgi:hypothetical protein
MAARNQCGRRLVWSAPDRVNLATPKPFAAVDAVADLPQRGVHLMSPSHAREKLPHSAANLRIFAAKIPQALCCIATGGAKYWNFSEFRQ